MKDGISVVLPAYKEAENLKKLLPELKKVLGANGIQHEIVVVDTVELLDETQEVCAENEVMSVKRKGGNLYGDAVRTGIKAASLVYTLFMDADGSHNPSDIPVFYERMKQGDCDLVIGSRYVKGGNSDNNFILKAMSHALNCTYRIVFDIKAKDVSNSFRLYKSEQLKAVLLDCANFDIVEEILIKLKSAKKGFRIAEIPVYFNKRQAGKSKRSLLKFIASYLKTMRRLKRLKNK